MDSQKAAVSSAAELPGDQIDLVIAGVEGLLLDFDGPVCRLFGTHRPEPLAQRLVLAAEAYGWDLPPGFTDSGDPHAILLAAARQQPKRASGDLVARLENLITEYESEAVPTAVPTPGVEELIEALFRRNLAVAIASNNSREAIRSYLELRDLERWGPIPVFGRDPRDPLLMKPHPDCLDRAARFLGRPVEQLLFLGDSVSDAQAASRAQGQHGMPFLGYAAGERQRARLKNIGATVVQDLLILVKSVDLKRS